MRKQNKSMLVLAFFMAFIAMGLFFAGMTLADDDGDLQMGVAARDPRFTDNGDGTVTDNLTGLIWLKKANCFGLRTWTEALDDCNTLAHGSYRLTDDSRAGDCGTRYDENLVER